MGTCEMPWSEPVFALPAGLPTVDHVVTHTPETVWKTVSGGPRHRKKKEDSKGGAKD